MAISKVEKTLHIKQRVLLWFLPAMLLLLISVILISYHYEMQSLHAEALTQIGKIETTFQSVLEQDTTSISGLFEFIQNNASMERAFRARDRQTLYDLAYPIFVNIRQKYRVTHFYFHDPNAVNFLRVHNRRLYGDEITRYTLSQAKTRREEVSGLELGPFGTFTLRLVKPWIVDGEVIGYIELGEEISHITPALQATFGSDFVFVIHKRFLTQRQWQTGLTMINKTGNWNLLNDFVIVDQTLQNYSRGIIKSINTLDNTSLNTSLSIRSADQTYIVGYFSLVDTRKKKVGFIPSLYNITKRYHSLYKSLSVIVGCFVATGIVLFIFFRKYLGNIETKLISAYTRLTQKIQEHEVAEQLLREANVRETNLNQELQDLIRKASNLARDAKDASYAKSAFLANMSHELRTPMNAIIGYSEMLIEDAEDNGLEHASTDLNKIRIAGKHLLALINDVLDLSKIEAGKMQLDLATCAIGALIDEVIPIVSPLAVQNNNFLEVHVADDVPEIYADHTKLRQSILNLLSNACKFTNEGTVRLEVTQEVSGAENWLLIRVQDTGIGIPPEHQAKLFQAFVQADVSTTRKYGGSGLGLAITKHFCQIMGGDVTFDSTEGQGTVFTIWLPVEIQESDQPAVTASELKCSSEID